ncbi:cytochrome P450 [Schizophyllum amplum]|uniref:Cytochrome P450 n=1 Tax=Schizophyllum amplum TaxID=97359 RepID=A0A550BVF7_9AGAR|nr:cytochrome P450 [Auriculariopsis ampla]
MAPVTTTDVLILSSSAYVLYKIIRYVTSGRRDVSTTPLVGPPRHSWFFGAHRETMGSADPAGFYEGWAREYGLAYALPGPLGATRVVLLDPKALAHFYARETWTYVNLRISKIFIENLFGRGILSAEGENHKRQRKALSPAFSNTAIRSLTSVFYDSVYKVKAIWDGLLEPTTEEGVIIDVQFWMNRISLDSIGIAGFGHDFGTIAGQPSPIIDSFEGFGKLGSSIVGTLIFILTPFLPFLDYVPTASKKLTDRVRAILTVIADEMLEQSRLGTEGLLAQKSIIGQIIKAEKDTSDLRMTREEVLAQNVLLIAGYETTSISLTWALTELSKKPEQQQRLRDELAQIGIADATWEQFTNNLPYLDAVALEVLRLHPAVDTTTRVAAEDDVIPLGTPANTTTGEAVSQIVVPKGTTVIAPIHAINRSRDLWGEDADTFRPERWLDEQSLGPAQELQGHKHLMSFIDGPRMCLGRGFALAEFKAVLSTLIRNYTFEWPHGDEKKILRYRTIVFRPQVEGEDGPRVPLRVRRVDA